MPATVLDLGKKVKAKYPGQYDDLPDDEVGRKVKAKFPGAYDDFADNTVPGMEKLGGQPPAAPKPPLANELKPEAEQENSFWTSPHGMIRSGIRQAIHGVEAASAPGLDPKLKGASEVVRGVGKALTPAAIPLAVANPVGAAGAIAGGYLGGKAAGAVAGAVGAEPGAQALSEDVGSALGGGLGVKGGQALASKPVQQGMANSIPTVGPVAKFLAKRIPGVGTALDALEMVKAKYGTDLSAVPKTTRDDLAYQLYKETHGAEAATAAQKIDALREMKAALNPAAPPKPKVVAPPPVTYRPEVPTPSPKVVPAPPVSYRAPEPTPPPVTMAPPPIKFRMDEPPPQPRSIAAPPVTYPNRELPAAPAPKVVPPPPVTYPKGGSAAPAPAPVPEAEAAAAAAPAPGSAPAPAAWTPKETPGYTAPYTDSPGEIPMGNMTQLNKDVHAAARAKAIDHSQLSDIAAMKFKDQGVRSMRDLTPSMARELFKDLTGTEWSPDIYAGGTHPRAAFTPKSEIAIPPDPRFNLRGNQ